MLNQLQSGLGCRPFKGGGSVVVDLLFIVTPIVGVCNCSMFCCTLLFAHSSIDGEESWLLCLICLPGVSLWLSGSSSRCHGVVCGL